jgi:hypothetical protein
MQKRGDDDVLEGLRQHILTDMLARHQACNQWVKPLEHELPTLTSTQEVLEHVVASTHPLCITPGTYFREPALVDQFEQLSLPSYQKAGFYTDLSPDAYARLKEMWLKRCDDANADNIVDGELCCTMVKLLTEPETVFIVSAVSFVHVIHGM